MKNFKEKGKTMTIIATAAVTSGDLVLVGQKVVVSQDTAAIGDTFIGYTRGVFVVDKETGAITQGQALYLKTSTGTVTTVSTGNILAGYAFNAALSADSTVDLLLVDNGSTGGVIAANVAAVSTANATDLATSEALANANKVAINAILVALKAAGVMTAD